MTTEIIRGACPHDCPDTCGIITEVEDGRAVDFYAQKSHPVTRGWLCAKVRPYLDHVYHPDRLKVPLRRAGSKGEGRWQRISWDEALGEISGRWKQIIEEHGAEAILPYSYSGTLGLVQMTISSARFWNRLGASQLERSICGAAAEMAVKATLGTRWSQPYSAVLDSSLVIIWGHNPVSTAPHFMPFLRKAQKNGTKLVVIDPLRTRTAKGADWHLAPIPGTDGALALGLANIIVKEGLHDETWLADHTVGWPLYRERIHEYSPEKVAGITGLHVEDLIRLARIYAQSKPSLIKTADGINRNHNGGQTVRAICALPALTGQYGTAGGGLSYTTSGFIHWDDEAVNKWRECPPPGRWVNMNRLGAALLGEVNDPPVKSLYVFGANPAVSTPNSKKVIEGLLRDDLFTVVHELFMTDTAEYADIVLPATSQLEHIDLHKAYGHTLLAYNHQAIPPLGESRSNWTVMNMLAKAMGFSESWLFQTPDEIIEEVLRESAAKNSALAGISMKQLRSSGFVKPAEADAIPFRASSGHAWDGKFPTPSGKVELYSSLLEEAGIDPLPGWIPIDDYQDRSSDSRRKLDLADSLQLVSPAAHHFVSSTFANQPAFLRSEGKPFVVIHPQDAESRGIRQGDAVILENGRGWLRLEARISDGVRRGVVASPKGRWHKLSGGRSINWTTPDTLADMAGQSTFQSNRVWVRSDE